MTSDDWHIWERITASVRRRGSQTISRAPALHVRVQPAKPSSILDLHGMTLAQAHRAFQMFAAEAARNYKTAIVITGRSGQIRREFPAWASLHPRIRSSSMMPNQGSFKVTMK